MDVASMPPAVTIFLRPRSLRWPRPPPVRDPRRPAYPDCRLCRLSRCGRLRMPMSALTMPQWSMISALVMTRSSAPCSALAHGGGTLAHAVANHFAAAEGDLVAVDGEIFLDFDDQFGIGQAHAVARGGAVEIGVSAARNSAHAHRLERSVRPFPVVAIDRRAPPKAPAATSFSSPGSKRIAVPAGISRRMP